MGEGEVGSAKEPPLPPSVCPPPDPPLTFSSSFFASPLFALGKYAGGKGIRKRGEAPISLLLLRSAARYIKKFFHGEERERKEPASLPAFARGPTTSEE